MALTHVMILGIGGLLVGIPILLHMLMQPKPKPLQFPALRFIQEMHSSNRRSLRLRHWILLLLRCLLLLAVAAAFARPSTASNAFGNWLGVGAGTLFSLLAGLLFVSALFFSKPANLPMAVVIGAVFALLLAYTGYTLMAALSKNTRHVIADGQAPVATLILVDNSPRLDYRHDNQTLLQKVQEHGRWLMGQLPLGSQIAVAKSDGEQPFFSVDLSAARKRLNTMDINYASVPLPDSLQQSVRFLADAEIERKEIYVFTDLTRVSWTSTGDSLKRLLEENPDISLFLIDVGVEDARNYSLDALQLSASSIPTRGKLTINTQVRASGPEQSMLARLMLEKTDLSRPVRRDGKTLVPEQHWTRPKNITVAEDSVTPLELVLQDDLDEGVHHGWIEIEAGDSLAVDDRRYFTIEVRPSWPVLVVHPPGVRPDNLVIILETAGGIFEVRTIDQSMLAGEPLSNYSAVFLLDPEPLTDPLWRNLKRYVESGGGLAVFLGHNALTNQEPDLSFRSDAAAEVLPGRVVRDWNRRSDPVIVSLDTLTHPILKEFRPLASLGIWQPFNVYRHWELESGSDPQVEVITRYTDGIGAVVQRRLDGGTVICMTTPITEPARPDDRRAWNDLFNSSRGQQVWPASLLVLEIGKFLASGSRDRINVGVGQSVTLHNDINLLPSEYRLFSPRDEEPVRVASADSFLRYKFTDTPGSYRLKGQFDDQPVVRGFSVNMAAESTDLQRIDESLLQQVLGEDRFQLSRDREEIERQQGTTRLGQEFYPVLALLMSLFLALELVLSNRFYKS